MFGTTSVQFNRRNEKLGLELRNATSSICWIFVPLFDEAHNLIAWKSIASNLRLSWMVIIAVSNSQKAWAPAWVLALLQLDVPGLGFLQDGSVGVRKSFAVTS